MDVLSACPAARASAAAVAVVLLAATTACASPWAPRAPATEGASAPRAATSPPPPQASSALGAASLPRDVAGAPRPGALAPSPRPLPSRDVAPAAPLPCREIYVGVRATAMPGLGGGAYLGQVLARDACATWSFEASATAQTLDGVFGGDTPDADYAQLLLGVKAALAPRARVHPFASAGFCSFKGTGTTDFLRKATTYYGAYLGVGADLDLGGRWSTGPDAVLMYGLRETEGGDHEWVPQLGWHLTCWL